MVDLLHQSIARRRLKVERPFNQLRRMVPPAKAEAHSMNRISMNNITYLAGAALITLGAVVAQIMLAAPASQLVMLG
jgi:hypothetical protein